MSETSHQTGTKYPQLFAALAAPFQEREVRVRSQAGRQLSYITARTAMNRLDSVLGPENWHDEYVPGEHSVICKLTIMLPEGEVLTKADAGGYAGMADQGDDDKSGFSDAFKRAAVKFGVGRYLYRDGVPDFVGNAYGDSVSPNTVAMQQEKAAAGQRSSPPRQDSPRETHQEDRETQRPASPVPGNAPRSGRALFAWVKEQEQRYEVGLLKYLNGWAKLQDYPGRMVDWDNDQVNHAYSESCRKLIALSNDHGDSYEQALAN